MPTINFAIKRLQFHSFETTFGASEAPGHGASVYDGLEVEFANGPTKKSRSGSTRGRPGATRGRPAATRVRPETTRGPHVRMSECPNVRVFEWSNIQTIKNAKMTKCIRISTISKKHLKKQNITPKQKYYAVAHTPEKMSA